MTQLEMEKVADFAGVVAGQLTGAVTTAMVVVGDELGFYATLARSGPVTPAELAGATGTDERLVLEWLAQQAAAGFVTYDGGAGTFVLPPEHAAVLADEDSPAAMAGAALTPAGLFRGTDKIVQAFRSGRGMAWGEQDRAVFDGCERFFRVAYRNSLVSEWIPALDGIAERLTGGAVATDIGCGHGAALVLLAQAYPLSRFVGYDNHQPSIEVARTRAEEAGVADRVRFERAGSTHYPTEGFDLICYFDSFHDLGDPVAAAAHARQALADGGSLMLVEPNAFDDLATNVTANPAAAMGYGASTGLCLTHSLSEPVGLGLGAQAGERRLRSVVMEAGFASVRRVAETPFHMVLECRA